MIMTIEEARKLIDKKHSKYTDDMITSQHNCNEFAL